MIFKNVAGQVFKIESIRAESFPTTNGRHLSLSSVYKSQQKICQNLTEAFWGISVQFPIVARNNDVTLENSGNKTGVIRKKGFPYQNQDSQGLLFIL